MQRGHLLDEGEWIMNTPLKVFGRITSDTALQRSSSRRQNENPLQKTTAEGHHESLFI
jgi:hypothetical protein